MLSKICRGLRTALIEREDFAAGTSSRSTKLVHGGVRYLEKAVFSLDYGQLKLVFEALHERKRLLENAPHLCNALPIMTVSTATLTQPLPAQARATPQLILPFFCSHATAGGRCHTTGLVSRYHLTKFNHPCMAYFMSPMSRKCVHTACSLVGLQ